MATKSKKITPSVDTPNHKGFRVVSFADFRHNLVYHVADAKGKINPLPVALTGHLAKDATKFHDAVVRGEAFVKEAKKKKAAKKEPSTPDK